jgi:hypothetical protein
MSHKYSTAFATGLDCSSHLALLTAAKSIAFLFFLAKSLRQRSAVFQRDPMFDGKGKRLCLAVSSLKFLASAWFLNQTREPSGTGSQSKDALGQIS